MTVRQSWKLAALLIGAGALTTTAQAARLEEYQARRAQETLLALDTRQPITAQFIDHAGRSVEIEGVVSGIITGDRPGFLLHTDNGQSLVVSAPQQDRDIAVGNRLRMLARIPQYGMKLDAISVTRPNQPEVAVAGNTVNAPAAEPVTAPVVIAQAAPVAMQQPVTTPVVQQQQEPPAQQPEKVQEPVATVPQIPPVTTLAQLPPAPAAPAKISTQSRVKTPAKKTARKPAKQKRVTAKKPATKTPTSPQSGDAAFKAEVLRYAGMIRQYNRNVSNATARVISYTILVKSRNHNIDPRLIFALIAQESGFNHKAVSKVGARGLGQLMPGTAAQLGVKNSFNIAQNVDGTIRYLQKQLGRFNGNISYALAAYNAGPGNVTRYGGIPPFRETQNYVRLINTRYNTLTINNL